MYANPPSLDGASVEGDGSLLQKRDECAFADLDDTIPVTAKEFPETAFEIPCLVPRYR